MGKIFYLMGKSSSGKDTIYKKLNEKFVQLKPIVLYTTRPRREHEKDGREYFFIDDDTVERFQSEGRIIEMRVYHTIHGLWKYLTVDDGQTDPDKNSYLAIGTPESYRKIKEYFKEGVLVPIYIEVEDGERLVRALEREREQPEPKYAEMCRRFLADAEDFSKATLDEIQIEKIFPNNDLERCTEEIATYIREIIAQ